MIANITEIGFKKATKLYVTDVQKYINKDKDIAYVLPRVGLFKSSKDYMGTRNQGRGSLALPQMQQQQLSQFCGYQVQFVRHITLT